jgi:GTPase
MKPIVAIVGRPNVGKSTLFNRITRSRDALVDNVPGVTRDRHYSDAVWNEKAFVLVDTGGFITGDVDTFATHIRQQVKQAIDEADAVILVLDGKSGLSPFDRDLIDWVRPCRQPVFYVINKVDGDNQEHLINDFYDLGLERLVTLSAEHGYGVPDFLDQLIAVLPEGTEIQDRKQISVAMIGRPNVGKSSLINRLVGQDRLVVSETPGTTRDAVDTIVDYGGRSYRLIDTAGIRRKSKTDLKLEKLSILKALKSLESCDVALIVLDAAEGLTEQDIRVAGYAHERGCGSIWVINKWDLLKPEDAHPRRFESHIHESAKYLSFAPVLSVSALTGLRVNRLFALINTVYDQHTSKITTGRLNRIIHQATTRVEPALHQGRRLKFYYSTQISTQPPTFISFVNYPDAVHFSYQRYLLNQIRIAAGLDKVPLRLFFRQRSGKLDFRKKS